MSVICTNEECSEFEVLKDNAAGFPVDQIQCGQCGQPVTEAAEDG